MAVKKATPPPDKNHKKVRELAEKLAIEGMQAAMFKDYNAKDMAQFCLDVAYRIVTWEEPEE